MKWKLLIVGYQVTIPHKVFNLNMENETQIRLPAER